MGSGTVCMSVGGMSTRLCKRMEVVRSTSCVETRPIPGVAPFDFDCRSRGCMNKFGRESRRRLEFVRG